MAKAIKLQARKGRWPKGTKWKITSIRIPFELAQAFEKRTIKAKVRSPSDGIIQVLQGFVNTTQTPRGKIKLAWAVKPDVSARKAYGEAPAKKVKKVAKKVVKVVKKAAKATKRAVTETPEAKARREKNNERNRKRRAEARAKDLAAGKKTPPEQPETAPGETGTSEPTPQGGVEGLSA